MAQRRLKQNFNEVQAILDAVGQKVDKIEGKGLSANDYTDQDKDKLASVEEDAQENVIEAIESDGVELPIENKTVTIPPHKQSDWSQNNSSSKDYIKNRTHWEENGVVHKLHPKFLDMDTAPTSGSTKPVTSGGVKEALDGKQDVISDLADIRHGAGLGETAYQKPSAGIPASDLAAGVIPDVSGFITRTVNDLANYYLKSETYTKEEVAALIGAIRQFHYEVYAALPATGEGNVLYLIGPTGSGSDKYEEYVYANNGWVKIGDTSIDLSGYVSIEALNQALAGYVTSAALATALTGKVGSETIHNIVELTQAEYDALTNKRDDTIYIITNSGISSGDVGIAGFEQTTVSTEDGGTNIWTVTLTNGQTFQLAVKNGKQGNSGYSGAAGELEVVNNLTDGGATAALSAEMGKELGEDMSQLRTKVDDLSTGKYYGYFATSSDLPDDATVDGFAYVGEGPTYTIYNLRGGVWTSSDITVNQSPIGNDEDIDQNDDGKLQFADRVYNTSTPDGMGYVILRKNKTFAQQVTATNTVYEIRYDFDLGGASVTIPSRSVLKFDGGRLSNGTVTGNNTSIEAGDNWIFDGVLFDGTWAGDLNACWVGAKKNDNAFDNSAILQSWFDNYCTYFPNIIWPRSNYYFSSEASLSTDKRNKHIVGDGSIFYVNIGTDDASFITLNIGEGFKVSDVRIINLRMTGAYNLSKNYALHFIGTQQFTVEDVEIAYFDRAIYLSDVYYGQVYGRVALTRNRIGIFMDNLTSIENNTMLFENVRINGCPVEAAKALYPQDTGESEEDYLLRYARCGVDVHGTTYGVKYRGIVVEGVDYGIRYNYRPHSTMATADGLVIIDGCYFETNTTNDIYIGRGYVINPDNLPNYYANAHVAVYANSCVFHGSNAVNVFIKDCVLFIDCVLRGATVVTSAEFGRTKVFHSDDVIVESDLSQLTATIEKGFNLEVPSSTGNSYPTTSRQTIVGLERNGVRSVMSPAGIDQSTYTQNGTALKRFIPERFSVTGLPEARYVYGIQPNTLRFYNGATYVEIPSGSGVKSVRGSSSNEVISSLTIRTNGIELYEFIRRWKAGVAYTGYVNQVFPYKVRAVPSTGLIYMEDHAGVEAVYGFGKKAIDDNTITFAVGKTYLDIETLCVSFYGYSTLRFGRDLVQCGRTYAEMLSSANSTASYRKAGYLLTTALRDAMTPRFNAVIYNSTTKQHEIYDGFQWVALTDPFKRYVYNDSGKSIAERATVPDLPNQTYYNAATGIEYKYVISGDKTSGQWVGGIGHILSLTNPNGYDATSNPLDYATELSTGEMVQYDGAFYKWDGTQFVAL